jgi:HD superfamily phosphohydrolase
VESVLLERYKENKWVIYHHKVLFYGELAQEVAQRLLTSADFRERAFVKYDEFDGDRDA